MVLQLGSKPRARLVDLIHLVPAITGKVELVYEGEQEGAGKVARHLIDTAVKPPSTVASPNHWKEVKVLRMKVEWITRQYWRGLPPQRPCAAR